MKLGNLKISKITKAIMVIFVVLVLLGLLVPLICMSFAKTEHLSGSTELSAEPPLTNDDGSPNSNYLQDAGQYFQDHFAFRPQMVTANALLHYVLLNDTATNQVVAGKDGYMFYSATMDDYLGSDQLNDTQLQIIAYNLSLVQQYFAENGADFIFSISPNKNSLYAKFMPWNYLASSAAHNAERLVPYLQKYGVNYCDMFELFNNQEGQQLYLKTDSHWNNRGALAAANKLLKHFGLVELTQNNWQTRNDFDGDLYAMTFPSIIGEEEQYYLAGYNDKANASGDNWAYTKGSSVEDSIISTKANVADSNSSNANTSKTNASDSAIAKSLYMYRDSFGNALIPYLSSVFAKATYSKMVPYDMTEAVVTGADSVIVERAERHLPYLAQTAPIMPAPLIRYTETNSDTNATDATSQNKNNSDLCSDISIKKDGNMYFLQGQFNGQIDTCANYQIKVTNKLTGNIEYYKPFITSGSSTDSDDNDDTSNYSKTYGFCARLWVKDIDVNNCSVSVIKSNNGFNVSSEVYNCAHILGKDTN